MGTVRAELSGRIACVHTAGAYRARCERANRTAHQVMSIDGGGWPATAGRRYSADSLQYVSKISSIVAPASVQNPPARTSSVDPGGPPSTITFIFGSRRAG